MKFQNYYFLSAVDWKSYLHALAITDTVELAISNQTRRLVANTEALTRRYGDGFNQIASTLDMGFGRLERSLAGVEASIESLAADFNYYMGLLLDELQIQREILIRIADRLDAIHETLKTPTQTKAREYFREGCKLLGKKLLSEALECFHLAEKEYRFDFFTQFQLGKLYLYGIDRENSVIDLKKAEHHLRLAVRYGKPEVEQLEEMRKLTAEALLHLSITCYAQAVELRNAGKEKEALEKVKEARGFAREATEINPQLSEAHYHLAKYSAVLGDTQQAISSLESAILLDRNYCLKVDADPDFDKIRAEIQVLFEKLTQKAKTEAGLALARFSNDIESSRKELHVLKQLCEKYSRLYRDCEELKKKATWLAVFPSSIQYYSDKLDKICHRCETIMESIRTLFKEARDCYKSNTYFDYLDSLSKVKEGTKLLQECNQLVEEGVKEGEDEYRKFTSELDWARDWILEEPKREEKRRAEDWRRRKEIHIAELKEEWPTYLFMTILFGFIGGVIGVIIGVVIGASIDAVVVVASILGVVGSAVGVGIAVYFLWLPHRY
jgi:hypothetical protein